MTVEQAKNKLIACASAELGYPEGPNNHNKFAAMPEITKLLGWNAQNQPWCNTFVNAIFIKCFGLDTGAAMLYQSIGRGSVLCKTSAQFFKDHNAFDKHPETGDVIFIIAGGAINHMGIVSRVVGGSVVTIEGNSSDQVSDRCYSVSDYRIAGYGHPRWELAAKEPENEDTNAPTNDVTDIDIVDKPDNPRFYELRLPYLSKGDMSDEVWVVQTLLQAHNISCGPHGADRDFGSGTEKAVREFQCKHGLQEDGIVGPNTGAALFGAEVYTPPVFTPENKEEPKADSFWNNLLMKIRK